MAIGLGIVLIIVGLILVLDVVNIDTSAIDTGTLGWILLVAGALMHAVLVLSALLFLRGIIPAALLLALQPTAIALGYGLVLLAQRREDRPRRG